ncbi:uncharacterized protein LOC143152482 isoform X2 [Ptiloglossa arizonensis]|uniref:uncharacterized protein LOC143152482 isoform X2 n=1 Tax=Ptiloglossa arizonensis TaxID=3350558 RepID=UPI003F9EF49D
MQKHFLKVYARFSFICILRFCKMENIEKAIELLHKRETIREEQFAEIKRKQILEYNNLMDTLQIINDERNNCKETITKNLQRLTTHKHSIYNLGIDNSENTPGLPISHNYHWQAMMFFSEAVNFINKFQNVYNNFDNINENNIMNDIASSIKNIESELFKIKSLITKINTLKRNVDILQEYCLVGSDEDMEM